MFYASKWLVRKYPNLLVLVAGICLWLSPGVIGTYIEDHIVNGDKELGWFEEFIYWNHHVLEVPIEIAFFLGIGITLAAIWRMTRRWFKPNSRELR